MSAHVNVIVVGGGAAGLAAAAEVERHGLTCQLLEAQARLGGRIHSAPVADDVPFDRGAQMINGDMTEVLALARTAGLHCAPIPATGRALCVIDGEVMDRDALISEQEMEELLHNQVRRWDSPSQILRSLWRIYHWWTSPWDSFGEAKRGVQHVVRRQTAPKGSLAAMIERLLLDEEDAALVTSILTEHYGADPATLDAKAFHAGLDRYASERDDLEFHFPAGMGAIVDALAAQLAHHPTLETAVTSIRAERSGLRVITDGRTWHADRVIVAAPPPVARQIEWDIENAEMLIPLLDAFQGGDLIKTALVYDTAFWRLNGWSGDVSFDDPSGLAVADTSFDDGSLPRLTAFLGGPTARARAALPHETRQSRLLADLARAFGDQARHPCAIHEANWVDDPWSAGGYNASVRLGGIPDAAAKLAQWHGPVRFAGAELDTTFAGYVEGAIRNGRTVAMGVAQELKQGSQSDERLPQPADIRRVSHPEPHLLQKEASG
ncbi:NAD(P)/FAD-dependent oxidoreductase [Gymnodinialimonas sp. 2305UL16-5]|uniref:flavin monoamine oxidase family protein n=1 Tax=Gymnodinialimonas mytili TaxID=3126503 RepID=UPI0030A5E167